jgi:hypothetical protein
VIPRVLHLRTYGMTEIADGDARDGDDKLALTGRGLRRPFRSPSACIETNAAGDGGELCSDREGLASVTRRPSRASARITQHRDCEPTVPSCCAAGSKDMFIRGRLTSTRAS